MSSLDDQCPTHDTRSAIQIMWSCLFIIFTCTWTAIHLNVPPPQVSLSKWRKLWWRIMIMLWTLMLPEMMVSWATYQWKKAREISANAPTQPTTQSNPPNAMVGVHDEPSEIERALIDKSSPHTSIPDVNEKAKPLTFEWTPTHSYFLLMGGFAIRDPETKGTWIPISWDDIGYQGPWPRFEEADILNLTKGEALAKTLVVLQVIWFVSQLCGRVIQRLAITKLEIMTLAYAIICAMLYMLWFSKPYDVQRPILLDESSYHPSTTEYERLELFHFLAGLWVWPTHSRIVGDSEFSKDFDDTDFWELNAQNLALFISATLFGGIRLLAWNLEFPSHLELMMWRIASFTRGYVGFTTQVREDGRGSSKTPSFAAPNEQAGTGKI
ncbi:hypothetical protein ONZ45_g18109 [Pleurotus djamor]|nr:hypothetical protein ONZ45_g18109 [Pleurotus djamor]